MDCGVTYADFGLSGNEILGALIREDQRGSSSVSDGNPGFTGVEVNCKADCLSGAMASARFRSSEVHQK